MTISALCLAALSFVSSLAPDPPRDGPMPSVLRGEPALTRLAAIGYDRSPTFRGVMHEIRSRRGVVILAWSPGLTKPLDAALMDRIRRTPDGVVCLWVGVRPTDAGDRLIAVLAHELQHAVEALGSGTPDGGSLEPFFRRIGYRRVRDYETPAAVEIQSTVAGELRSKPPSLRSDDDDARR